MVKFILFCKNWHFLEQMYVFWYKCVLSGKKSTFWNKLILFGTNNYPLVQMGTFWYFVLNVLVILVVLGKKKDFLV